MIMTAVISWCLLWPVGMVIDVVILALVLSDSQSTSIIPLHFILTQRSCPSTPSSASTPACSIINPPIIQHLQSLCPSTRAFYHSHHNRWGLGKLSWYCVSVSISLLHNASNALPFPPLFIFPPQCFSLSIGIGLVGGDVHDYYKVSSHNRGVRPRTEGVPLFPRIKASP